MKTRTNWIISSKTWVHEESWQGLGLRDGREPMIASTVPPLLGWRRNEYILLKTTI
jgi:hypothetical protein